MRMRTIAGAALVAAVLSITLTGAASAATPAAGPPGDAVIITCRDGKPVERRATDAEREQMRKRHVEPSGEKVRVVEPRDQRYYDSPEKACADRR